jgi:hypothetical protein
VVGSKVDIEEIDNGTVRKTIEHVSKGATENPGETDPPEGVLVGGLLEKEEYNSEG